MIKAACFRPVFEPLEPYRKAREAEGMQVVECGMGDHDVFSGGLKRPAQGEMISRAWNKCRDRPKRSLFTRLDDQALGRSYNE